jgi:hypothetical protein
MKGGSSEAAHTFVGCAFCVSVRCFMSGSTDAAICQTATSKFAVTASERPFGGTPFSRAA